MDYLTLKQAKDLIPQIETNVLVKWVEANKSHTKGDGINLEIEKDYYFKAFNLSIESSQTTVDQQDSGINPPNPIKDMPKEFNTPENEESEPLSEDFKVEEETVEELCEDILETAREIITKAKKESDDIRSEVAKYQQELDSISAQKLTIANSIEELKREQESIIKENEAKIKENDLIKSNLASKTTELKGVEDKLHEILPIYQGVIVDLTEYQSIIKKFVKECELRIDKDGWYAKAVAYFNCQDKKIERVTK